LEEGRASLLQFDVPKMAKEELQARRFVVTGLVQGVGFRNYVEHAAGKLGVQGYVRNRLDGSVEVLAMGKPEQLGHLRAALQKGPMMSHVSGVSEEPDRVETEYLGQFTIEYTV
jgi:acylphosphatase